MRAQAFVFVGGLVAGWLLACALNPGPRTIIIPEAEPLNVKLLQSWKGNSDG